MKHSLWIGMIIFSLSSCITGKQFATVPIPGYGNEDTLITQSLFTDRSSSISEDNIQIILNGSYKIPSRIRMAVLKLGTEQKRFSWDDEDFQKNQQSYVDILSAKLKQSARVDKIDIIPGILISNTPSFTGIREAAVRMRADMVLVYAINGDVYSKYKVFAKTDIKAFATIQVILLDVRTGLIPFSAIVTKDQFSQKKKEELDYSESRNRVRNEAVLLTLTEIGDRLNKFLSID